MRTTYVIYGSSRRPLYVGCSANVDRRLRQHSYTKTWWKDARRVERQEWPTETEGWQAEIRLIRELRPLHNVAYNSDDPPGTCNPPLPAVLSHDCSGYPAGTPLLITHQNPPNIWLTASIAGERVGHMLAEWSVIREGATGPWLPAEDRIARFHRNSYAYHWWKRDAPRLAAYLDAERTGAGVAPVDGISPRTAARLAAVQ